jgi:hypothetical protein
MTAVCVVLHARERCIRVRGERAAKTRSYRRLNVGENPFVAGVSICVANFLRDSSNTAKRGHGTCFINHERCFYESRRTKWNGMTVECQSLMSRACHRELIHAQAITSLTLHDFLALVNSDWFTYIQMNDFLRCREVE